MIFIPSSYAVTPAVNNRSVTAVLYPSNAPSLYNDLNWKSSDESVAKIVKKGNQTAVITGLKNGTATITVTAPGGASAACIVTVSGFETANKKGDINGDGEIDTLDAVLVLQSNVGLTALNAEQKDKADVNGDGSIDTLDAVLILQYNVGMLTSF